MPKRLPTHLVRIVGEPERIADLESQVRLLSDELSSCRTALEQSQADLGNMVSQLNLANQRVNTMLERFAVLATDAFLRDSTVSAADLRDVLMVVRPQP